MSFSCRLMAFLTILLCWSLLAPAATSASEVSLGDSFMLAKVEFIDASYSATPPSLRTKMEVGRDLLEEVLTTRLPDDVGPDEVWVRIDLVERSLKVYRGHIPIKRLDYLAFGASGSEPLRLQGSYRTPTGEFRVDRINRQSKFRLFYGIDYPNKQVADQALEEGVISKREHRHIHNHIDRHGQAPAGTSLGGYIGIHGLGRSDPEIHSRFDWTQGCVAVTNDEIMALSQYMEIGTRVVIRG